MLESAPDDRLAAAHPGVRGTPGAAWAPLPLDGPGRRALDAVVDAVRDRYGTEAVRRAALLDGGEELAAWRTPIEGVDRRGIPGQTERPSRRTGDVVRVARCRGDVDSCSRLV